MEDKFHLKIDFYKNVVIIFSTLFLLFRPTKAGNFSTYGSQSAESNSVKMLFSHSEFDSSNDLSKIHSTLMNDLIDQRSNSVIIDLEFLYLKVMEDALRYGEVIPQVPIYQPTMRSVDQHFSWAPASRVGITYCLPYDNWNVDARWTWVFAHPDSVSLESPDYSILANLATPILGSAGNSLTNYVKGRWSLRMNVIDLDLKRTFCLTPYLWMTSSASIRGCMINQKVDVHYGDYIIVAPDDNTPQKVIGRSEFYGIGPEISVAMEYRLPQAFSLFLSAEVAGLYGEFSLRTSYRELLNAPSGSKISLNDRVQKLLPCGSLRAGIGKKWLGKTSVELFLGWEAQIWWDQMMMNWFSNVVAPQEGANLTLTGGILKNQITF